MSDHSKPSRRYSRAHLRNFPTQQPGLPTLVHSTPAPWPEEECLAPVGTVVRSDECSGELHETRVLATFTVPLVRAEHPIMRRVYTVGLFVDGKPVNSTRTWFQASMQAALDKLKGDCQ